MNLKEARRFVRDGAKKGVDCPCCGQYAKIYERKFNSTMARAIILLSRYQSHNPGRWIHAGIVIKGSDIRSHDWYGIRYWDLIEQRPKDEDGKGRTSGMWRVTQKGYNFAGALIELPSHVTLYNGNVRGFSVSEISIMAALGKHFDYLELMGMNHG